MINGIPMKIDLGLKVYSGEGGVCIGKTSSCGDVHSRCVDHHEQKQPDEDPPGQVLHWVLDLLGDEVELVPAVVGEAPVECKDRDPGCTERPQVIQLVKSWKILTNSNNNNNNPFLADMTALYSWSVTDLVTATKRQKLDLFENCPSRW